MFCGISGESPQAPVVSKKSGIVYEKHLIEQYINEHGTEPGVGHALSTDDLLSMKPSAVVRPRPPTLTSIPALLAAFQNEWDALALETYNLKEQLARTREELSTALYQNDAAVRVVARLMKEKDEARDALSKVTVTGASANGGDMEVDSVQTLPEALAAGVDEKHQRLTKERKKRPIPEGWVTADEIALFESIASTTLELSRATSLALEGDFAALGTSKGQAAIYSLQAHALERLIPINQPVTDTLWAGSKLMFATSHGAVKVFQGGNEVASAVEHAGPAVALSSHPGGDILASVGTDKSVVMYEMSSLKRVGRVFTDTSLTTCAFHPDGHLIGFGTVSGDIKLFVTKTLEEAAVYSLDAPIEALAFCENGFWLAATAKGQSTATIFDLRKFGDAARAKVLDLGGVVQALAWDFTGQYLATAGPSGLTVQQYVKSSKKWTELFRNAVPGVAVRWGACGKKLVAVDGDGVVTELGAKA